MKKRILAIVTAFALVFALGAPATDVSAYYMPKSEVKTFKGTDENGFTWLQYPTVVSITGYTGIGGAITIPSTINGIPVTSIDGSYDSLGNFTGAFEDCKSLTSVTIPDSITFIERYAFSGCSELTSVTISNSITYIGSCAFSDCTGLTSLTIPGSIKTIDGGIFSGCSGLTDVTIENGVTSIGNNVFLGCSGLTSVTIPNSVTSIGRGAFKNCGALASVIIPNSVSAIGLDSTSGDRYSGSFENCTNLKSIAISSNVESIYENTFAGCKGLTNIIVDSANNKYKSVNGVLFDKAGTTLEVFPGANATKYIIPRGVTTIGNGAFSSCEKLASITIPDTVISVEGLKSCVNLTDIWIVGKSISWIPYFSTDNNYWVVRSLSSKKVHLAPNLVKEYRVVFESLKFLVSIGNVISSTDRGYSWSDNGKEVTIDSFRRTYSMLPNIDETYYSTVIPGKENGHNVTIIGDSVFEGEVYLASVSIPNSVTSIGKNAFNACMSISNIQLPTNLKHIGAGAFRGMENIYEMTIPSGVTSIGKDAFRKCPDLRSITILGNAIPWAKSASAIKKLTLVDTPSEVTVRLWSNVSPTVKGYFAEAGYRVDASLTPNKSAQVPDVTKAPVMSVTIYGTSKVGKILTAKVTPSSTKISYQWYADGVAIKKATKPTFKVTRAQIGKSITVKVTGTVKGGKTGTAKSKGVNGTE